MTIAFREAGSAQLPARQPSSTRTAFAVTVYRDLDAVEPLWRALAGQDSVASPYQGLEWIRLWHEHVSGPLGEEPVIIIGSDRSGTPLFIWPLVAQRLGPLRLACFFGDKHATLNMPLWRRDIADTFTAGDMRDVLSQIARQRPDLDLLMLHSQPAFWNGARNPFMTLAHQRSNEDNFVLNIGSSGPAIIEQQISSTMRSRLRNKERKLAKLNGYRYVRAATPDDVDRQLGFFFQQKEGKLHALGIENAFAQPGVENFIRAACHAGLDRGEPVIELHALECDGDMLALFSGIHDQQRFTSMFNSHTASDNSRFSPGLILLQHLIVDCATRGFQSFDIGPGEARYKTFFCKDIELIYDSVLPLSLRGQAAAPALRAIRRAKSAIKRNPKLWQVAHNIRALLGGHKPKQASDAD